MKQNIITLKIDYINLIHNYLSTGFPSLSTNPDFKPNLSLKGLSQS